MTLRPKTSEVEEKSMVSPQMDLVHSELVKLRDRMPARAARVKKLSCPRRRFIVETSVARKTRSRDGRDVL